MEAVFSFHCRYKRATKEPDKIFMKVKNPKEMTFLVVDDVDNMRRSIRAMLKLIHYGREFYEAANGRDAWKILQDDKIKIDFIISDYYMPSMSGTELLHLVRANKKMRDIPFLMITAEANMDVVAEAAEHDVDAYMTKPFVTATLEQKINGLIEMANNPDPLTLHLANSREREEKGDIEGAIEEAKQASTANPQSSRPFRELGRLLIKKGDFKKAQVSFEKAIELNKLDVSSYHFLGQIFFRLGKTNKAIDNFSKAMAISPRHSDRALNFAKLLLKKNQKSEAEKVLRIVLRNNPNDIDFKEDIADTCSEFGLYDLAVKIYLQVLKDDPERFYLNKKMGITLHRTGDNNEAVKVLEKATEKFGEDIELLLLLARIYMQMGLRMRADNWANKVVRIDPKNEEAREILRQTL